jgi:DNA-binding transcriptional regulator GbsR (MarR family)
MKLTEYEKKYIIVVGKRFGVHGRSEVMGQIFALLNLRARSPESAMSQQEIAELIVTSLSTVSRTLKKLVEGGYCSYILEDNELDRAERRYHATYDYKEFILARFAHTLGEARLLVDDLTNLSKSISEDKRKENIYLLEQIDRYIDETNVSTKIIEKLQKELIEDLDTS